MQKRVIFCLLLLLAGRHGIAQVPVEAKTALARHDSEFSTLAFEWQLNHKSDLRPAPSAMVNAYVEQAKHTGQQIADEHHIHDPAKVASIIAGEQEVARRSGSGMHVTYDSVFHFTRDQDKTLVWSEITEKQPDFQLTTMFHQWYGPDWAVAYADYAKGMHGEAVVPPGPYVWGTSGDGTLYFSSPINCLDITPEEFVLLTGKNPSGLLGAKWQLVSTNAVGWTLQATVVFGKSAPVRLHITLNRQHGCLPSEIVLQIRNNTDTYRVVSWRRYQDAWMPERISYIGDHQSLQRRREWTTKSVQSGTPVQIQMPFQKTAIMDTRLLGNNLGFFDIGSADKRNDPNIVYYQWTGRLPTLDELRGIKAKFLKDNPPSSTNRWLLMLGTALITLGGGWWLRSRKPLHSAQHITIKGA